MEKKVKIDIEPKEVAGLLHEMDTGQLADVFIEWNRLIKKEYEAKPNFWPDLGACMIWVAAQSQHEIDLHEVIRAMYAASIATLGVCDFSQVYKPSKENNWRG